MSEPVFISVPRCSTQKTWEVSLTQKAPKYRYRHVERNRPFIHLFVCSFNHKCSLKATCTRL